MVRVSFVGVLGAIQLGWVANAHITLKDIDALTSITNDANERIRALSLSHVEIPSQEIILNNQGLKDEAEDTIAGSLTYLDGELLRLLNIPVKDISIKDPNCPLVAKNYHAFLASTTRFLQAVDERQHEFRWDSESTVFNSLGWMQSLWASRTANEQHLSFIEQQVRLYKAAKCFGDSNDVLRHDVEIVEYLNDLIDSF